MSALMKPEPVPVGGLRLLCAPDGRDVWVFFDTLCHDVRVSADQHWYMINDPIYRDQFRVRTECGNRLIDYRCVPTWLNKIDLRPYSLPTRDDPTCSRLLALQTIQRDCAGAIERHFFGPAAASPAGSVAPANGKPDRLAVIQEMLDELREQRSHISRLDDGLGEVKKIAIDAHTNQVLGEHARCLQVRTCCGLWGLPDDTDSVRPIGQRLSEQARREGWFHRHCRKVPHSAYTDGVNVWDALVILRWFTANYGTCKTPWVRELLSRHDGLSQQSYRPRLDEEGWTPFA